MLTEATLYRDAGQVKRWHVKRTHRTQTVAEHTFGMLMLVKQMVEEDSTGFEPFEVLDLYNAILHHDLPELMTGDIPAPIKRAHPQLGPILEIVEAELAPLYRDFDLTQNQAVMLKWADRMELVLWCVEEYEMGNRNTKATIERGLGWIMQAQMPLNCLGFTNTVVRHIRDTHGIHPATGATLEMKS